MIDRIRKMIAKRVSVCMDKYMYASFFLYSHVNGIRVRKKEHRKDNMDKKDKDKKRHKCRARKKEEDKEKERGRKKKKAEKRQKEGTEGRRESARSSALPIHLGPSSSECVTQGGWAAGWLAE